MRHMTPQVLDAKTNTFISPATETRSVLRQRQVVPLEHNWVWSKTTESMVQLQALQIQKHLFIFTMLLNFVCMARYGVRWHVKPVPWIMCWESPELFPSVFAYCKQSRTEGGGGLLTEGEGEGGEGGMSLATWSMTNVFSVDREGNSHFCLITSPSPLAHV